MTRHPDHPVDPLFLTRQSFRAFTDEAIPEADLLTLLEAARWAPSGSNLQPVRMAWARRGAAGFATMAGLLAPGNRVWAEKAAALVAIASTTLTPEGAPHPSHAFDAGAAWMSLALQAHLSGWVAHAMGGFDKAATPGALGLPPDHAPHVIVAIGRRGDPASLPEALRPREAPSPRKPLDQIAAEGGFPPAAA